MKTSKEECLEPYEKTILDKVRELYKGVSEENMFLFVKWFCPYKGSEDPRYIIHEMEIEPFLDEVWELFSEDSLLTFYNVVGRKHHILKELMK